MSVEPPLPPAAAAPGRPLWQRVLWSLVGALALVSGIVGILLPLLPTTPFVLLAAFCSSSGSARLVAWLLAHPCPGPPIAAGRAQRGAGSLLAGGGAVDVAAADVAAAHQWPLPSVLVAVLKDGRRRACVADLGIRTSAACGCG